MTIFKSKGFNSIIGADLRIEGTLAIGDTGDTLIVGSVRGDITSAGAVQIEGNVDADTINVAVLVVTGRVAVRRLTVGTLAVKKGAVLAAETVEYKELVIETGATLNGTLVKAAE